MEIRRVAEAEIRRVAEVKINRLAEVERDRAKIMSGRSVDVGDGLK